jgi:hypothetical protein
MVRRNYKLKVRTPAGLLRAVLWLAGQFFSAVSVENMCPFVRTYCLLFAYAVQWQLIAWHSYLATRLCPLPLKLSVFVCAVLQCMTTNTRAQSVAASASWCLSTGELIATLLAVFQPHCQGMQLGGKCCFAVSCPVASLSDGMSECSSGMHASNISVFGVLLVCFGEGFLPACTTSRHAAGKHSMFSM